jgi:hypothetical protein
VKSEIDEEIRRSELKELQKRMDEAARNAQQTLQGAADETKQVLEQPVLTATEPAPAPVPASPVASDHPAVAGGLYLGGDAFVTRTSGPSRSFPLGDLGRTPRPETEAS